MSNPKLRWPVKVVLAMGAFGTGIGKHVCPFYIGRRPLKSLSTQVIFVELFRLDRFLLDFSEGKIKVRDVVATFSAHVDLLEV